jgi:hypothetical protein
VGDEGEVGDVDLWSQPPFRNKHENAQNKVWSPPTKRFGLHSLRSGPFIAKAPQPTTGIPHRINSPLPFASSVEMPRHVWLCTRPLAYEIPGMDITSNPTRPYLRHWGVLISELSIVDVRVLIQSINSPNAGREVIGTIYQLMQYNDRPDIFVDSKTTLQMIQTEWKSIHLQYVGETLLTHDVIIQEGMLPGNPMI